MKTKEFKIEISETDADNFISKEYAGVSVYKDGHTIENRRPIKGRLIIELPEKSVSITESQITSLCDSYYKEKHNCPSLDVYLSQKLFGKDAG